MAYNIKSKFEEAYEQKKEAMAKVQHDLPEANDKATYGAAYYNPQRMA